MSSIIITSKSKNLLDSISRYIHYNLKVQDNIFYNQVTKLEYDDIVNSNKVILIDTLTGNNRNFTFELIKILIKNYTKIKEIIEVDFYNSVINKGLNNFKVNLKNQIGSESNLESQQFEDDNFEESSASDFPLVNDRVSIDPHINDLMNIISALSMLKGAFLNREINTKEFFNSCLRVLIFLNNKSIHLSRSSYRIIEQILAKPLKFENGINQLLNIRDFVSGKKLLFIDDKIEYGWADILSTILLINPKEINEDNCYEYYSEVLESRLLCTSNYKKGEELIKTRGKEFSIIILDLLFPGNNGFELLKKLKLEKEFTHIPVLIFSSSFSSDTIIEALDEKLADSYFCKTIFYNKDTSNLELQSSEFYKKFKKSFERSNFKSIVKFRTITEIDVYNDINKWLKQFPENSRKYALRLLRNIDFKDRDKIEKLCKVVYEGLCNKLNSNKLDDKYFIGLGPAAKSGHHILYYFRQANFKHSELKPIEKKRQVFLSMHELPNSASLNSLDKEKLFYKNNKIILVDDIVGSGKQFCEEYQKLLEHLPFLSRPEFNDTIYYLVLLAKKEGIDFIEKKHKRFKDRVIVGEYITDKQTAFSKSNFLNTNELKKAKKLIKLISDEKKLYVSKEGKNLPFGYNKDGLLIVWEHNTPNNTLPIFWASKDTNEKDSWFALFPRKE